MEILTNTNRERLISIAENYVVNILEDRRNNIEDLASAFANAGFTKLEFFQISTSIISTIILGQRKLRPQHLFRQLKM